MSTGISTPVIIKKRARHNVRTREPTLELEVPEPKEDAIDEKTQPLEDLIELRKLRRLRGGIDVAKLNKGDPKKKKKAEDESVTTPAGLVKGAKKDAEEDDDHEESKARRVIRTNNFTQQTNALDVDKHMLTYIEESMKQRRGGTEQAFEQGPSKPLDPQDELFRLPDKYKTLPNAPQEEGNVTNSMAMLTAIPEVDLGMDTRLKNIEETEKAKRVVAEAREKEKRKADDDAHLAATRFYNPRLKHKSDADIIRDAKLEAMGLHPENHDSRRNHERPQSATDEMVMERFKKRMRK